MTPNVSDPGGGGPGLGLSPGPAGMDVSGQLVNNGCNDENISQLSSPPKPVSTLQHNYSNIHQPIPRPTSLTSSRTQSSNTSPVLTGSPLNLNGEGGAFTKPQPSGQSNTMISSRVPRTPPEERVARREKMVFEEAKKSRLADINDLIHLDSPITEDAVIRTLQSRYFNQKYVVSTSLKYLDFSCQYFFQSDYSNYFCRPCY